jgi:hypothetical protein
MHAPMGDANQRAHWARSFLPSDSSVPPRVVEAILNWTVWIASRKNPRRSFLVDREGPVGPSATSLTSPFLFRRHRSNDRLSGAWRGFHHTYNKDQFRLSSPSFEPCHLREMRTPIYGGLGGWDTDRALERIQSALKLLTILRASTHPSNR